MLTELTLINFRSHEHTTIKLHAGVNVIIGRGQAGKTNIKRGLELLCTNKPTGASRNKIHSNWMKKGDITTISTLTIEGHRVTFNKPLGGSVNYEILWADGKRDTFDKVGVKVPDLVTQVLNIGELNLQGQLDLPYMVTSGTSEISRTVNKVVDLEIADKWLTNLNSRRTRNTQSINSLKKQQTDGLKKLEGYKGLSSAETVIIAAEKVDKKLRHLYNIQRYLDNGIVAYQKALAEKESLLPKMRAEVLINKASNILMEINRIWELDALLTNLSEISNHHEQCKIEYITLVSEYMCLIQKIGKCPICFTPATQTTIKRIKEELI